MEIIKKLLLVYWICALSTPLAAQQKYAFLVGINNYYDKPDSLSNDCLKGCVNDANLVNSVLINNYDFNPINIKILLDSKATKANVTASFLEILAKCKAGDVFVFFYSGHGIIFENLGILKDQLKHGYNQAMVLSDLYTPNYGCFFTDSHLKTIMNKFVDKKVIVTTILDCCYSGNMSGLAKQKRLIKRTNFNGIDSAITNNLREIDSSMSKMTSTFEKGNKFNGLQVFNPNQIQRPYERPSSQYMQFAGTSDIATGQEIKDELGYYHGGFTKAFVEVLKNNGADIKVNDLMSKTQLVLNAQLIKQTPKILCDSLRLQKNILGIPGNFKSKVLMAKCISKNGDTILLNKGWVDGLGIGNILKKTSATIEAQVQIVRTDSNISYAKINTGNLSKINAGDHFNLINPKTISAPILKINILPSKYTQNDFAVFLNEKINPLTKLKEFIGYDFFSSNKFFADNVNKMFFNDAIFNADSLAKRYLDNKEKEMFFPFLPIPKEINDSIKKALEKNQNLQLVNSYAEADYTFYLNKEINPDDGLNYSFSFQNFNGEPIKNEFKYYDYIKGYANLPKSDAEINALINDLKILLVNMVREKTKSNTWLNNYPK